MLDQYIAKRRASDVKYVNMQQLKEATYISMLEQYMAKKRLPNETIVNMQQPRKEKLSDINQAVQKKLKESLK